MNAVQCAELHGGLQIESLLVNTQKIIKTYRVHKPKQWACDRKIMKIMRHSDLQPYPSPMVAVQLPKTRHNYIPSPSVKNDAAAKF